MKSVSINLAAFVTLSCLLIAGGCGESSNVSALNNPEILIGKTLADKEVTAFLSQLPARPERYWFQNEYHYRFWQSGIELIFDRHDRIIVVYLHPGDKYIGRHVESGDKYYGRYIGRLPGNLRFSDSRSDVIHKLGIPNKFGSETDKRDGYSWTSHTYYLPTYGLCVHFSKRGKIWLITLMKPGTKPWYK